jgi:hypothetical protein
MSTVSTRSDLGDGVIKIGAKPRHRERMAYMPLTALRPGKPDIRRMRREYRLLCEAQAPIERVFWQLEQRKGQLADQLANEGVAPFCRPRRAGQSLRKRLTRKGGSMPLVAFSVRLDRIEQGILYQAADGSFPLSLPSSGIKRVMARLTVITALGFRGQTHLLGPLLPALNVLQEPARGEPDTAQRVMKQPPADPLGLF